MVPELHEKELIKNETTWVGKDDAQKRSKPVSSAPRVLGATPLRLRFEKRGALQYISHLDLNRTMQRLVLRAGVPIWYTEGFNPQPKIVFAAPLSVGCESVCELADIKITANVENEAVLDSLMSNSPDGLRFTDVYVPETKFTAIMYASYKLTLSDAEHASDAVNRAAELFASPVVVSKRSKSGVTDTDITTLIKAIRFTCESGEFAAEMTLRADSAGYLNPEYIIAVLRERLGIAGKISLCRTEFLCEDGSVFR